MSDRPIENTVRYRAGEVPQGRTDWARLLAMTEAEIDAGALVDPDNPPMSEEELAAGGIVLPSDRRKVPISIRLDEAALERFKEKGPRYQTRLNELMVADSEGRVLILDDSVAETYAQVPSRTAVMNAILRVRAPAGEGSGWNVRPTGMHVRTTTKRDAVVGCIPVSATLKSGHAS